MMPCWWRPNAGFALRSALLRSCGRLLVLGRARPSARPAPNSPADAEPPGCAGCLKLKDRITPQVNFSQQATKERQRQHGISKKEKRDGEGLVWRKLCVDEYV